MLAFLDRPGDPCGGEPLAGLLRPGNAGANTVADQIEVAEEALEQLPADVAAGLEIVLRCDSAGATHGLLEWAREGGIRFSVGFDLTEPVRKAIARIPDERWVSALNQDGSARDNGEVAEATDLIDLSGLARGLAADRLPRAPAPRSPALLHRRRRAPLSGDPHRPQRRPRLP